MYILLNPIIQLQRLHKSIGINKRLFASIQLREKPSDLIQDRILSQHINLHRENTFPEGSVHVQTLEYAISIASSSEIGQTSGGGVGGTKLGGEIGAKSLDDLGSLLPETGFTAPVRRGNKAAETVGVVTGVDSTALTKWLWYHEKLVHVFFSYIISFVYLSA